MGGGERHIQPGPAVISEVGESFASALCCVSEESREGQYALSLAPRILTLGATPWQDISRKHRGVIHLRCWVPDACPDVLAELLEVLTWGAPGP